MAAPSSSPETTAAEACPHHADDAIAQRRLPPSEPTQIEVDPILWTAQRPS